MCRGVDVSGGNHPLPPSGAPHLRHGPLQREGAPEMAGRDSEGIRSCNCSLEVFFAKNLQ